mgnify:CR=1 FL=1
MEPGEFIKTCFAIACVMTFGVICIKASFAFVDWLAEQIRKAILKRKIKRLLRKLVESKGEALRSCKDLEGFDDLAERTKVERK